MHVRLKRAQEVEPPQLLLVVRADARGKARQPLLGVGITAVLVTAALLSAIGGAAVAGAVLLGLPLIQALLEAGLGVDLSSSPLLPCPPVLLLFLSPPDLLAPCPSVLLLPILSFFFAFLPVLELYLYSYRSQTER
mgnify:CR=1 FL=1